MDEDLLKVTQKSTS